MNNRPLMKCGHIANAYDKDNKPCCAICNCFEIAESKPNIQGRKAKCRQCGRITDSDYNLPFFEYRKNSEYDSYYCGCYGWD